jgi:hypothetical protein
MSTYEYRRGDGEHAALVFCRVALGISIGIGFLVGDWTSFQLQKKGKNIDLQYRLDLEPPLHVIRSRVVNHVVLKEFEMERIDLILFWNYSSIGVLTLMSLTSFAIVGIVLEVRREGLVTVDFSWHCGCHADHRFLPQLMKLLREEVFGLVLAFGKPQRLVTVYCLKVQWIMGGADL